MTEELFELAVKLARARGSCSVTELQRAFKISYTHAVSLCHDMQRAGVIDQNRRWIEPCES